MIPKRKYEYVIIRNDEEIGLNEYGFDYLINLEKVLDEIRKYIEENKFIDEVDLIERMAYGIQEVEVVETDELLQILDKVNLKYNSENV